MKEWMACLLLAVLATACIQEEALNTEADIESVELPGDVLVRYVQLDAINNETEGKVYPIVLYVKKDTDVSKLAPELTLTPGATVVPESGTVLDFSTPQTYIVTSGLKVGDVIVTEGVGTSVRAGTLIAPRNAAPQQ